MMARAERPGIVDSSPLLIALFDWLDRQLRLNAPTPTRSCQAPSTYRRVWERAYGPLLPGEVVHHRNHDRFDNRLTNLLAMTEGVHVQWHHALRRLLRALP